MTARGFRLLACPFVLAPALTFAACHASVSSSWQPAGTPTASGPLLDDDEEIPLDQVPQVVKDAALAAVPGLVLEEAEKETENGVVLYCLEGAAGGKEYEVEVTENGTVVEVEDEGDDDDDDDEDDEDHDD